MSFPSIQAEVVSEDIPAGMDAEQYRRASEANRQRLILAASLLVLILAAVLSVQNQTRVILPGVGAALPEFCLSRIMAGVSCPGCGLTRCFISVMHGDLVSAWKFNPAGLLALAVVVFQVPYRLYRLRCLSRDRPGWKFSLTTTTTIYSAFGAALILQWIVRLLINW